MPNLKDIRKRISSVKNTQKITSAMKMVASSKLRKAQHAVMTARPYSQALEALTLFLIEQVDRSHHPLLARPEPKTHRLVMVIGADRGLCGAYNSNVHKALLKLFDQSQNLQTLVVGRRVLEFVKSHGMALFDAPKEPWERPIEEVARDMAEKAIQGFLSGQWQEVFLIYTHFRSALVQEVQIEQMLPLIGPLEKAKNQGALPEELAMKKAELPDVVEYLYEPNKDQVLDRLLSQYMRQKVIHALLESHASEQGARMSAMDNATNNAGEMISNLTLQYNRARQAAITRELIEIISGAEAL